MCVCFTTHCTVTRGRWTFSEVEVEESGMDCNELLPPFTVLELLVVLPPCTSGSSVVPVPRTNMSYNNGFYDRFPCFPPLQVGHRKIHDGWDTLT